MAANGCGWEFGEPLEEKLAEFFASVTEAEWSEMAQRCAAVPEERFKGEADYRRLSERLESIAAGR